MEEKYKILACMCCIPFSGLKWFDGLKWKVAVNFLVLCKELDATETDRKRIEYLELLIGLPTRMDGTPRDIAPLVGESGDYLKVYCINERSEKPNSWVTPNHILGGTLSPYREQILYGNKVTEKDAKQRWEKVKEWVDYLNKGKTPFSTWIMGSKGCINGNSAYYTLLLLMGIKLIPFDGFWCPGIKNTMISEEEIEGMLNHQSTNAQDETMLGESRVDNLPPDFSPDSPDDGTPLLHAVYDKH